MKKLDGPISGLVAEARCNGMLPKSAPPLFLTLALMVVPAVALLLMVTAIVATGRTFTPNWITAIIFLLAMMVLSLIIELKAGFRDESPVPDEMLTVIADATSVPTELKERVASALQSSNGRISFTQLLNIDSMYAEEQLLKLPGAQMLCDFATNDKADRSA